MLLYPVPASQRSLMEEGSRVSVEVGISISLVMTISGWCFWRRETISSGSLIVSTSWHIRFVRLVV